MTLEIDLNITFNISITFQDGGCEDEEEEEEEEEEKDNNVDEEPPENYSQKPQWRTSHSATPLAWLTIHVVA